MLTLLHVAKVREGIVFHSIEKHEVSGSQRRVQRGHDRREIGVVGIVSVADVDQVRSGRRQTFLIALPRQSGGNQLIGDGLANGMRIRGDGLNAVNVDVAWRPLCFVGEVNRGCRRVRAGSPDGADDATGGSIGGDDSGR